MTISPAAYEYTYLDATEWQRRIREHEERIGPWIAAYTQRRSRGEKHPVYDFLFQYYTFRPAQLGRWSPGLGTVLDGASGSSHFEQPEFTSRGARVWLDARRFPNRRIPALDGVIGLLRATSERSPCFHCFGLHEWAMVYRREQVRHEQVPLRLSRDALDAFLGQQAVCCSHYDAFRFFSGPARPLNRHQPSRRTQSAFEQPGCLHANMDLYKWAYKFSPWTPSALVSKAFLLAVQARELDMRASPYDLRAYGFDSVRVETQAGRETYGRLQRDIAQKARPIRAALLRLYERMHETVRARE